MARFVLMSGALFCLAIAACAKSGSLEDAGRTGQAGGGAGAGAGAGSSGGVGGGGAGGGVTDAAASDAPVESAAGGNDGGAAGSGIAGSGGAGGASGAGGGGASGSGGTGAAGAGGTAGNLPAKNRTGKKSAGCGKPPVGASTTAFTNHRIALPPCAACTAPNCPSDCIAPPFVPGGVNAQTAPTNGETFLDRDFTIQLPANYDPDVPSPVFFGADGCGPQPPLKGAGFSVPGENNAIKVGLQQVDTCFADGGQQCAHDIKNVAACVNGPELPYFLAVQKWVESNFCVDLGTEFLGGGSSGAWEAFTLGCASANTLRGFYSLAGGKREHRWPCNGPVAAFMIVTDVDTLNPVGPLATLNTGLDSFGAAPGRDEVLARNGCVGKDSVPFDPKFPACVKYTGCPAAYPVVWCEFAGGSHDNPTYNNVNYLNAVAPFLLGLPPAP